MWICYVFISKLPGEESRTRGLKVRGSSLVKYESYQTYKQEVHCKIREYTERKRGRKRRKNSGVRDRGRGLNVICRTRWRQEGRTEPLLDRLLVQDVPPYGTLDSRKTNQRNQSYKSLYTGVSKQTWYWI